MGIAPWATVPELGTFPEGLDDLATKLGTTPEAIAGDALQLASDVLYQFTGRRWPGLTTTTMRPCCACSNVAPLLGGPLPGRAGGHGLTVEHDTLTGVFRGSGAWGRCLCYGSSRLELPLRPVVEIVSITIDGDDVAQSDGWRVDDHRYLVRTPADGGGRRWWPPWQRMDRDLTDDDTFGVTWRHGRERPQSGHTSVLTLANELLLGQVASGDCRLPKRVQTVTRQGVTLALLDPLSLFAEGRTGVADVDLWIGSVQFGHARRGGAVLIPGQPRAGWHQSGTDTPPGS